MWDVTYKYVMIRIIHIMAMVLNSWIDKICVRKYKIFAHRITQFESSKSLYYSINRGNKRPLMCKLVVCNQVKNLYKTLPDDSGWSDINSVT